MPFGAILGAAGSLVSGIIGSNAASSAGRTIGAAGTAVGNQLEQQTTLGQSGAYTAGAQAQQLAQSAGTQAQGLVQNAAGTANQYLSNGFNQVSGATNPYMTVGNTATQNLNAAYQPGGALAGTFTAPTAAQAMQTPGYQFQLQQGQQAIQRQAAAAGQLNSGATAKSLDAYSQGLASTYYQQAYNNALTGYQTNYSNSLNSLLAGSNLGLQGTSIYSGAAQNAAAGQSANTMNAAQYMGNTGLQAAEYAGTAGTQTAQYAGTLGLQGMQAAGNAYLQGAEGTAAGQVGSANAWQNAINGIAGAGSNAASYFTQQQPIGNPYYNLPITPSTLPSGAANNPNMYYGL
jgi:hypothetical protein